MENNLIKKALLSIDVDGEIIITEKSVSKYAPINRILDKVGFYSFDFIEINSSKYIIVFEDNEKFTKKTKLLVARISNTADKVIDINKKDQNNLYQIAKEFMVDKSYLC